MPPDLDRSFSMRCTLVERDAWHDYAQARGVTLAELTRTILNNMTGIYDPPRLDLFPSDELSRMNHMLVEAHSRRRQGRGPGGTSGVTGLALWALLALVVLASFSDLLDLLHTLGVLERG